MSDLLRNLLGLPRGKDDFNIERRPDLDPIPPEELAIERHPEMDPLTVEQIFPDDFIKIFEEIKIEDSEEFGLDKSLALAQLIEDHDVSAWKDATLSEGENNIIFSPAEIMKMYADLSRQNLDATELFFSNMRKNATQMIRRNAGQDAILMGSQEGYIEGDWMSMADLREMTRDWNLPLALHRRSESHYTLILKLPEKDSNGNWRVLVYDPLVQGEVWDQLPDNFNPDYAHKQIESISLENDEIDELQHPQDCPGDLESNAVGIFLDPLAREMFVKGAYAYDVRGDEEVANNEEDIVRAKRMRLQFDGNNCGLACYMMAAIRAGLKNETHFIEGGGRAQVYRDTGVRILMRDEVLGRQEPTDFAEFLKDTGDDIVVT